MLRRSFLLTILLLALAVGAAFGAPVTIKVAIVDDPGQEEGPFYKPLVEEFEKANPNIKVELAIFYRENFDKLAVQIAGGVAPDIIAGYGEFSSIAVREGVFLDLMPLIIRDKVESSLIKDFVPAALAQHRRGTALYGFPKYSGVGSMYLNMEMFNAAGMTPPVKNWTWDDFARIAKRMTLTSGNTVTQYGFALNPTWIWVNPWFYAGGVDFSDPYYVKLDTPGGIATGELLQDLYKSRALLWSFGRFSVREAAMTSALSSEMWAWADSKIDIHFAPMPIGPGGRAAQMNNDITGIFANTKHKEEAWTFLKWWFGVSVQRRFLAEFPLQPARRSLGRYWIDEMTSLLEKRGAPVPKNMDIFLEATEYAVPQPLSDSPDVVSSMMLAVNKVVRGQQPVRATFETHTRIINAMLAEMKAKDKK